MIQTVYFDDFRQAFQNMDRGEQFSYDALELIYEYLEECDPDMELDVIAICCDFEEMTPEEVAKAYDLDEDEDVMEFLNMNTSVCGETSDTIVFQSF